MNLALPAPVVEEAIAPKVENVEPATAEMARPSNSMLHIHPPPIVEPAVPAISTNTNEQEEEQQHHQPPKTSVPPLSVEGLRTTPGSIHFESDVVILPRAPNKNILQILLPCLYDDRNFVTYGEVKKYCFMKDAVCYVYIDRTDPNPLYQISFHKNLHVQIEDRYHPHRYSTTISPQPDTNLPREEMKTVLIYLKGSSSSGGSGTNQLLYQFTFDTTKDSTVADRFLTIVQALIHH